MIKISRLLLLLIFMMGFNLGTLFAEETENKKTEKMETHLNIVGTQNIVKASAIVLGGYTDPQSFNGIDLNTNTFSNQEWGIPRCTIENLGYVTIDLSVSATISGGMSLGTHLGDVGPDRCVLAGVFTYPLAAADGVPPWSRDLNETDFGHEDVIGNTMVVATNVVFASSNDFDWYQVKGYDVPAQEPISTRSMRFMLQGPTSDSTGGAEQTIRVVIGSPSYNIDRALIYEITFYVGPDYTPTVTSSCTSTRTITMTPTISPTLTPSPTISVTSTITTTNTRTPTFTMTQTSTPTLTCTPTSSITQTATISPTSTHSPVCSITQTGTPTYTSTPSATISFTATRSATSTMTSTISPTGTITATPVDTVEDTPTSEPQPTLTRTPIPTNTPFVEEKQVTAYPNPARGKVNFAYTIAGSGKVQIDIYKLTGERVASIVEHVNGGAGQTLSTAWDAVDVAPGIYFCRIVITDGSGNVILDQKKKVALIK